MFPTSRYQKSIGPVFALLVALLLVLSMWPARGISSPASQSRAMNGITYSAPVQRSQSCSEWLDKESYPTFNLFLNNSSCGFSTTLTLLYYQSSASPPATNLSRVSAPVSDSSNATLPRSYSITFMMDGLAEINSAGQIVQYSNFSGNAPESHIGTMNGNYGVDNESFNATENVTQASGVWTPRVFSNGGVTQTGPIVSRITVELVFHIQVSMNVSVPVAVNAVKFDVNVNGWPWEDTADHLGVMLGTVAEAGAHFGWNQTSQNLTEATNSGGARIVSLLLDSSASTFGSSQGPGSVVVSSEAGLYAFNSSAGGANILVNFTGGNEGYTVLHYDPWFIFGIYTGSSVASVMGPTGGGTTFDMVAAVAIVAGSGIGIMLGVALYRARRTVPDSSL